jgi:hypothetical protein
MLMTPKVRLHDGIIGALLVGSVALAHFVDVRFLGLAGLTGLIMFSSAFTGFCPVHWAISKLSR